MGIPGYPSFRPIELGDKPVFDEAFTRASPLMSEYTFTNLYSWREAYRLQVSALGTALILSSQAVAPACYLEPAGPCDKKKVIETIGRENTLPFIRVSEATVRLFGSEPEMGIEPDPDNFDYVYRVSDLVTLKGKKYDGKRYFVRKFASRCLSSICPCRRKTSPKRWSSRTSGARQRDATARGA